MSAIIFDTETTGLNEPTLVEAAWLEVLHPRTLARGREYCARFNPGKAIEFGAMATHHITNDDVEGMPPSSRFRLPDGVEYLIGHNVDFDWAVIGKPEVKRICTLAFSRTLWPEDSHSLGAMMYRLEPITARDALRKAHSADADVEVCWRILNHIVEKIGEPATWEEVWIKCEAARIPTVMTFGKHKGVAIKDVPRDYKSWLLRQPDVDPYLEKALRA